MKILFVSHMARDAAQGGPQVQIEVSRVASACGHSAREFTAEDVYATPAANVVVSTGRRLTFWFKIRAEIRRLGADADVVEAHHTNIPFRLWPKHCSSPLLVARSSGLVERYARFEAEAARRWPGRRGRRLGRVWRWGESRIWRWLANRSLGCADLINVPTHAEAEFLIARGHAPESLVVLPNGVRKARLTGLREAAEDRPRLEIRDSPVVVFVGQWSPRKGSADWGTIVRLVRLRHATARFVFLGVGVAEEVVAEEIDRADRSAIHVLPRFDQSELPSLLASASVGAFPSYMEGFGLAVLEKIAAGLPTVAYDIPGPADILRGCDTKLLVRVGDTTAFANAISRVIDLSREEYDALSQRVMERAQRMSWELITFETLEAYNAALGARRDNGPPRVPR